MPDKQRESGICEICGKKMTRFKHQGPGIADFWKCEPCESAAPAQPASPSPGLTPSAELMGSWPKDCIQRVFVDGAAWWEFKSTGATLWQSDRDLVEAEAINRYGNPEAERPVLPVPPDDWQEQYNQLNVERYHELQKYQGILEAERTKVSHGVTEILHILNSRDWLTEGRGPYTWNDDNWHKEFAYACQEIRTALEPLQKIARDLSNCPTKHEDVVKARASSPAVAPQCPNCESTDPRTPGILTCGHEFHTPAVTGRTQAMGTCAYSYEPHEKDRGAIIAGTHRDSRGREVPCCKWAALRESAREAPSEPSAIDLACRFHTLYEGMAPHFGYATRPESNRPWSQVPPANQELMIAVCNQIISEFWREASPEAPAAPDFTETEKGGAN